MGKTVYLLYEGDQWLSSDSMVLMGIFTSEEHLKVNAEKLIREHASEHLNDAESWGYDFDDLETKKGKMDSVVEDILLELMNHHATSSWRTNYSFQEATLNELGEL